MGTAAAAAWTGPALASLVGNLQILHAIASLPHARPSNATNATDTADAPTRFKVVDACGTVAESVTAAQAGGVGKTLSWCNLDTAAPFEASGAQPVGHLARALGVRQRTFDRALQWAVLVVALVLSLHFVVVKCAAAKAARLQRQAARLATKNKLLRKLAAAQEKKERTRRQQHAAAGSIDSLRPGYAPNTDAKGFRNTLEFAFGIGRGGGHYDPAAVTAGEDANPGDVPPDVWRKLSNTHPRLAHYVAMAAVTGVAMACSGVCAAAHAAAGEGSAAGHGPSGTKVFGAVLLFVCWPVAFICYTAATIRAKVVVEKRALLLQDDHRTEGLTCWCDMPATWDTNRSRFNRAKSNFYYSYVHSQHARAHPSTRAVPIARTCHTYDHTITESNVLFSLHPPLAYTAAFWTSTAPCSRISSEAVGACTPSSCSCATGWRSA